MPKQREGHKRAFIIFSLWLLTTGATLAIGFPLVRTSIRQSGVLSLLGENTSIAQKATAQANIWFYTADGNIKMFRQDALRRGGSTYHDAFETLLAGPSLSSLKQGAASFINGKTYLVGITLSHRVLYVSVSKHFLESPNLTKAYEQLRRTAVGFSQVKDMVLLIDGEQVIL